MCVCRDRSWVWAASFTGSAAAWRAGGCSRSTSMARPAFAAMFEPSSIPRGPHSICRCSSTNSCPPTLAFKPRTSPMCPGSGTHSYHIHHISIRCGLFICGECRQITCLLMNICSCHQRHGHTDGRSDGNVERLLRQEGSWMMVWSGLVVIKGKLPFFQPCPPTNTDQHTSRAAAAQGALLGLRREGGRLAGQHRRGSVRR